MPYANPEDARARARRQWAQRHQNGRAESQKAYWHRRRAGGPGMAVAAWRALCEFVGGCFWCLCPLPPAKLERDHLTPVAAGGRDEPANIVPACRSCNARKGARDAHEFARECGFRLDRRRTRARVIT